MMKKKLILLGGILLITMTISLLYGRYGAGALEAASAFVHGKATTLGKIMWQIRLPRILFVVVAGGILAISGQIFQTIFKNPLASGDVLGATSGCALGAALAIVCFNAVYMRWILAFIFGLGSISCCLLLASKVKGSQILNLVISGMIMQAICNAFLMIIKLTADPYQQLGTIEFWLMGGFSDISWQKLMLIIPLAIILMLILYRLRWQIQLLAFGQEANSFGIDTKFIMAIVIIINAMLLSSVVALCGVVSWVGLLVPHIIRLAFKADFCHSFTLNLLGGGIFLLICDTISRNMFAFEVPISIITSIFGSVFLIILFVKGMIDI